MIQYIEASLWQIDILLKILAFSQSNTALNICDATFSTWNLFSSYVTTHRQKAHYQMDNWPWVCEIESLSYTSTTSKLLSMLRSTQLKHISQSVTWISSKVLNVCKSYPEMKIESMQLLEPIMSLKMRTIELIEIASADLSIKMAYCFSGSTDRALLQLNTHFSYFLQYKQKTKQWYGPHHNCEVKNERHNEFTKNLIMWLELSQSNETYLLNMLKIGPSSSSAKIVPYKRHMRS